MRDGGGPGLAARHARARRGRAPRAHERVAARAVTEAIAPLASAEGLQRRTRENGCDLRVVPGGEEALLLTPKTHTDDVFDRPQFTTRVVVMSRSSTVGAARRLRAALDAVRACGASRGSAPGASARSWTRAIADEARLATSVSAATSVEASGPERRDRVSRLRVLEPPRAGARRARKPAIFSRAFTTSPRARAGSVPGTTRAAAWWSPPALPSHRRACWR